MNIWLVSMECSGIAEAGGVKDVVYALCNGFSKLHNSVTLFIPAFGCTRFDSVTDIQKNLYSAEIDLCCKNEKVYFSIARIKKTKIKVVFIHHPSFENKNAVYVYTQEDQNKDSRHKKGTGHEDSLFLDALFSKSVAQFLKFIPDSELPEVIHCHDASTAVLPWYAEQVLGTRQKKSACVVTIHNAGPAYHHCFESIDQAKYYTGLDYHVLGECANYGRVEPFLLGAKKAKILTVSDYYAQELTDVNNNELTDGLSSAFFYNNIKVTGITNGIDYDFYNPSDTEKSLLPFPIHTGKPFFEEKIKNREFFISLCQKDKFLPKSEKHSIYTANLSRYGYFDSSVDSKKDVFIMYHGRIVWQKGISVFLSSLDEIFNSVSNCRILVCGQGDAKFEEELQNASERFAGKFVFFKGYNNYMARLSAATSDFALMPSFFEPCGLEDFIAQIYGSLPIAHATGGLKKILNDQNGFLYQNNDNISLTKTIIYACFLKENNFSKINEMIQFARRYIKKEYNWQTVIKEKYINFFKNNLF